MNHLEKAKQIEIFVKSNFNYRSVIQKGICLIICNEIMEDLMGKLNDWSQLRNDCEMNIFYCSKVEQELKK